MVAVAEAMEDLMALQYSLRKEAAVDGHVLGPGATGSVREVEVEAEVEVEEHPH